MGGQVSRLIVFFTLASPIIAAQESVTVNVPDIAKAGETVTVGITLDKAPNFDGGSVLVWVTGPGGWDLQSGAMVTRGSNVTVYSFRLPIDADPGTYTIDRLKFSAGSKMHDLHFTPVSFRVIGNAGLIIPSSAEVAINPTQAQLLRREATRLQLQIQQLKAELSTESNASERGRGEILRDRVQGEIKSLQETASRFRKLGTQGTKNDASEVFFADLHTSYDEVLSALGQRQATDLQLGPRVVAAALSASQHGADRRDGVKYNLAALAVFRVFEQNEIAYTLVADTGSLTFDLAVSSSPEGAAVSYRRRGDPYLSDPNPTNSVIKALPYAIWIVRFQKPGFRDREIEHDPFREPNHIVTAALIKK